MGSCFPNTVITRVLSCGLKDFCQNKSYEQGCESPKLKSVVGILGHLAGSHSDDIQKALLDLFNVCYYIIRAVPCIISSLFQWSLEHNILDSQTVHLQKKATIPFLLQLSFLSSTLLSSVTSDIQSIGKLVFLSSSQNPYFTIFQYLRT